MQLHRLFFGKMLGLAALVYCGSAQAISFDRFAGSDTSSADQQSLVATGPVSTVFSVTTNSLGVLGGSRYLQVSVNGGFKVDTEIDSGRLNHSQQVGTKGTTFIAWDGDSSPGIQPTGLKGLDLTADEATAIKLKIEGFDFAFNKPLTLTVTIYDASDPTGAQKVSVGTATLSSAIFSPVEVLIPFSSFTKESAALAPADLSNAGAITLLIDGSQNTDVDLALSFVGTNGRCDHIPVNGLVVDQCGVCNGNNTTCADCEGTPNGPSVAGTSCSTGQLGTCGEGSYTGGFPVCSCSPLTGPGAEVCDGLDNDCDGEVDEGLSCLDCKGEFMGAAKLDSCGVCGGDDSSCITCNETNMTSTLEALDGGAKQQERLIVKAAGILRPFSRTKKQRSSISSTLSKAHKLQLRNWILSWTIPVISKQCETSSTLCTTSSNTPILKEYRANNSALRKLGLQLINRIKASRRGKLTKRDKKLQASIKKQYTENLNLSKTVPENQYSCADVVEPN